MSSLELNYVIAFRFVGQVYCNRTFDGWGCWNDTLVGTRAFIPCPPWANEGFDAKCEFAAN